MRPLAVVAGLLIASGHATAEKRISVKITHSSLLADAAGVRISLGRVSGDCSREFADLLLQDMHAHEVGLIASNPGASQPVPAAVLSIDVTRCEAHNLAPILGSGLPAMHISRTEGFFAASIRAADPASGRELAAATVHGHAQKENESQTLAPEYPAPAEVKLLAVRHGLTDAARLYTPWIETREVPFADGNQCHLKQAAEAAKSGDYEALVRQSQANAEACAAGSKPAMEAWYNLGVASMLVRRYSDAIAAFEKAAQLKGAKLVGGLLAECRQEAAILEARRPKPIPAAPAQPGQTGVVMTNDFVMQLVNGNVAEAEILKMIASQPCRFSLDPAGLERLKAAGVPASVVAAMRNKH